MVSESANPTEVTETEWDATWTGTKRAQLEAALSATPAQRLAWLEEAMRLAHASGAPLLQFRCWVEPQSSKEDLSSGRGSYQ